MALQFIKPKIESNLMYNQTTQEIRFIIGRILNVSPTAIALLQDDRRKLANWKNCYLFPVKKDRKSIHRCIMCCKPVS